MDGCCFCTDNGSSLYTTLEGVVELQLDLFFYLKVSFASLDLAKLRSGCRRLRAPGRYAGGIHRPGYIDTGRDLGQAA